ncbi:replication protein A 70 kDa DNA-binding subunit A-like [Raphanus sativus]|uniref:Replication protein A 70 kDa DNA-binding subunit A-like n=1 Tax=Raphanus sativus TaxID=3726 RepID=A0A6J0KLY7_RAPSA|nr:replication protein A 70 kDa DNA-binding subunit A-like [Raphanus sativus]
MVLADITGNKIQCSCKRSYIKRVQRSLPLGKWKVIENMKISGTGGKFKPTKLSYKMNIINDTVFTDSDHNDDSDFLTLTSFEEILGGSLDTTRLIEILGQAVEIGGVQIIQVHNEDRKRVQFRLRDNNGNELACCLWGSYAERIEQHVEKVNGDNIVCLIRFAKISEFQGEVQITNAFGASLLDLDPTMHEAVEFKEKLRDDVLPLAVVDQNNEKSPIVIDDWDDVGIIMISELHETTQLENVKIVCSIEAIDTDWAWYYFACKKCGKIVTRISRAAKPLFRCAICKANVSKVFPKFKLHLIAEDDSGKCKLVLLGTIAQELIGFQATELWDGSYDDIEDPEILPQPIMDLVGKSFCFGIESSENGSDNFTVSKVWSGDILQKIETESEPVSLVEGGSSSMSSERVMLVDVDSQTSSGDCMTPYSKRKESDNDFPDITSTSKKICTAAVKTEKPSTD